MSNAGHAPTGTVSFLVYSTGFSNIVGVGSVDGNGNATLTASNPVAATSYVQAIYSGDTNNGMVISGAEAFTVLPAQTNTTTALTAADSVGSSFSVSVLANSGTAIPSGSVQLTSNGVAVGSATLTAAGTGMLVPASPLPAGTDTIVANYSGDTNYLASVSNSVQVTPAVISTPVAPAPVPAPQAPVAAVPVVEAALEAGPGLRRLRTRLQ